MGGARSGEVLSTVNELVALWKELPKDLQLQIIANVRQLWDIRGALLWQVIGWVTAQSVRGVPVRLAAQRAGARFGLRPRRTGAAPPGMSGVQVRQYGRRQQERGRRPGQDPRVRRPREVGVPMVWETGSGAAPRSFRTVVGFHGANGDAILGILRTGTMRPKGGKIWLNLGDHRQSYMHGADRARGASFVAEVHVTYDASTVQETRTSTAGVPNTLELATTQPLPATISRLFRRRRTEEGFVEDLFTSEAAIVEALR